MTYARDPYDTDEPPCFCGQVGGPERCPAHGDPDKPEPERAVEDHEEER